MSDTSTSTGMATGTSGDEEAPPAVPLEVRHDDNVSVVSSLIMPLADHAGLYPTMAPATSTGTYREEVLTSHVLPTVSHDNDHDTTSPQSTR